MAVSRKPMTELSAARRASSDPSGMTRRAALALAGGLALAGCSSGHHTSQPSRKPAEASGNVEFWTWAIGLDKVVKLYNSSQSKIKVNLTVPPAGDPAYTKMFNAIKAGSPPDLAHVEFTAMPDFVVAGGVVDLGAIGANDFRGQYVDWTWRQGVFGGKTYALPWASGALGYYYRADLYEKYGLGGPPATWTDFLNQARKLRKAAPKSYLSFFGPDTYFAQWWIGFPWQAGANWFGTKGDSWTVDVDSQQTEQVAQYWQQLLDERLLKVVPTFSTDWFKGLQDGSIAALPAPLWMDSLLKANAPALSGKWRVAPLPLWDEAKPASSNYGGSSLAVLKGARNPAAALEFANWMTTDPQAVAIWLASGNGWPAVRKLDAIPSLSKTDPYYGGQNIFTTFAKMDALVDKSWIWPPTSTHTFTVIADEFNKVVAGKGHLSDALSVTQGQVIQSLKAKGIKVGS